MSTQVGSTPKEGALAHVISGFEIARSASNLESTHPMILTGVWRNPERPGAAVCFVFSRTPAAKILPADRPFAEYLFVYAPTLRLIGIYGQNVGI